MPVLTPPKGEAEFWELVRRLGTPVVGPDPQGDPEHEAVTFLCAAVLGRGPSRWCRTRSSARARRGPI